LDEQRRQRTAEPNRETRLRFHSGESAAVDELIVAFYDDVVRFASAITADDEHRLDVAQETFLRAFELHATYDPTRSFRPWLFGIARRCSLEIVRKARKTARVVDLDSLDAESPLLHDDVPTAAEILLRQQLSAQANHALAQLDESSRAIVHLHLFEELTFREVAQAIDRPASAVATAYYRAIARLRDLMDPRAALEKRHGE